MEGSRILGVFFQKSDVAEKPLPSQGVTEPTALPAKDPTTWLQGNGIAD